MFGSVRLRGHADANFPWRGLARSGPSCTPTAPAAPTPWSTLADALLCAPAVPSVAYLSLEPAHRRGWGSAYDALASGRIDTEWLRDLLVSDLPDADPLVFAVDVTTWSRAFGARVLGDQEPTWRSAGWAP